MEQYNKFNNLRFCLFLIVLGFSVFLFLSLVSFNPNDPVITVYSGAKNYANLCGKVGSYFSGYLILAFGFVAFIIPFLIAYLGWMIFREETWPLLDILFILCFIISFSIFISQFKTETVSFHNGKIYIGGFIFNAVVKWLISLFNSIGTFIITFLLLSIFFLLAFRLTFNDISDFFFKIADIISKIFILLKKKLIRVKSDSEETPEVKKFQVKKKKPSGRNKEKSGEKKEKDENNDINREYDDAEDDEQVFPPDSILTDPPEDSEKIDDEYLNGKKKLLIEKFNDFGITGEVVDIITGPVVTLFEFEPAPGIKLSKITSLANDLTMALKALSVRIIAPIPGKSVVGIEIPNEKRKVVFFKELIRSKDYLKSKHPLTIALGKTVDGSPYVSNLAKMPHLLVAGSTGAGKSVCINTMLISILYNATEKDVRFILVDPKMLELSVYNGIPHLLLPVITDPEKAAVSLRWAIGEMDRRYELLAEAEVRDIGEYNRKIKDRDKKLPYIVVVIDELADLMMIAPKDVETSIARIAQKARAAGIHLILATQRPSVDVITGVIKNNLPSRIAFKVTSRADSRTILDSMGAESLLGYGDMLFIPPGSSNPVRLQGAFISNDEILKVTDYLKKRAKTDYMEEEILNYEPETGKTEKNQRIEDMDEYNEPLYKEVKEFVRTLETVSISMLQRRFKIGYNKSATFVERMEKEGLVGPADGSKPRKVLKNR
jgi:S-DNA-T family DNA segregation ATPase FtsK/SpoIIIE